MMKRYLYIGFMLCITCIAAAQKPHSYYCDFEDAAENAKWQLNTPKNEGYQWVNQWAIGSAISNLGAQSLYISPDSGKHVGYMRTESRMMIAWREMELEAGHYDIAFDWLCGGDSARAALMVAWIPESQFKDITCGLNDDYKSRAWVKDNMLKFNGSELLTGGSIWTHTVNTLESDGTPHRLVYFFVYSSAAQLVQPGPCVDNIQLCRNNCGTPTNMKSSVMGQTAKFEWESTAESFNLRVHKMGDSYAGTIPGIKQTNYSIQLPEGVYDLQIQVVCQGDTSVWYNFPTAFVYETKCFDYLDLTDERCSFSMETASDYHHSDDVLEPGKIDYGFTSMWSRHTIHYHPEEYDVRTRGSVDSEGKSVPMLKTVPDGALASVRVGSWEKMARSARVEYDFVVDAREASVLMLQYAMVLESSGHEEPARPRLTIDIVDANTGVSLSPCTTVDLAAKTEGEGWYRVPDPAYPDGSRDVCWRDWTTLGLNLAEYHGRHVKVKITSLGCTASIHYGYAYFVLTCTSGQIKGMHCGWTPTNEFIAPEGFNYRWYKVFDKPYATLGQSDTLKIDYRDTCTYAVEMTYKSNKECGFTLYANATPRFPIPEATYTLEQRDCGNYITFNNTSHIRTRNWITGEEIDTSVPVEYVVWDFGGFIPEGLDTQDKMWSPSFRLPDEEADYHFSLRAIVGLCDSTQEFDIHVPRVGQDSLIEDVQLCEGQYYRHNGKYFQNDTVIIDHDYNIAGCDSFYTINLRFVNVIRDSITDTIPEGSSYTIGTQTFKETGVYSVTLRSMAGCDSIVTLDLLVVTPLTMEITSVGHPCPEDPSFLIETHARKGIPNYYELTFNEKGEAVGLETQSDSLRNGIDNTIEVPLPDNVQPGYYPFSIRFNSQINGATEVSGEVMIHYSRTLIQQRWDDVLGILNAEYNGGYDFQTFQWYRNGVAIEGATSAYLYVGEGQTLIPGERYSVEMKGANEERAIRTCEYIVPERSATPTAAPQKRLVNGSIYIMMNGSTYNAYGQKIK